MSGNSSINQCLAYTAKPPPDTNDWMAAYLADASTALIIATIGKNKEHAWTKQELNTLESQYRDYLRSNSVSLIDGKLVLQQALDHQARTLTLIIVLNHYAETFFPVITLHRLLAIWVCTRHYTDFVYVSSGLK